MKRLWSSGLACVLACAAEPAPGGGEKEPPASESNVRDLAGQTVDPFTHNSRADLLLFIRTDCPISNRYAPELERIVGRFATQPLDVWLVYVDEDETPEKIQAHMTEYRLPGTALRDPGQFLATRAGVKVTPEAALFDADGQRRYRGRIDDRHVDYGKQRAEPSTHELLDAITAVMNGQIPSVAEVEAVGCPLPPLNP